MVKIIINFIDERERIHRKEIDDNFTIERMICDFLESSKLIHEYDKYFFKVEGLTLNKTSIIFKQIKHVKQIKSGCLIKVYKNQTLAGGGGIETVDVSKNITKEYEPGNSGPFYRAGCNGLCIQSTCKNEECEAHNDRIFIRIGYVSNWNLLDHQEDQVVCPCCMEMVIAENYWFKDCYYQINYIKVIDGRPKKGSIEGEARYDKYKTFDEKASGKGFFSKLVFNVTKRLKNNYK